MLGVGEGGGDCGEKINGPDLDLSAICLPRKDLDGFLEECMLGLFLA